MADAEEGGPTRPRLEAADLESMTAEERRELMLALTRLSNADRPATPAGMRRRRLVLVITSSVLLVPWTIYIGSTVPDRYVVHTWTLTWTGFDIVLTLIFAATAVLGLLRRQLVVLAAFTAGVLLLCDAWFDVTTANAEDRLTSIAGAALLEVPVAILLISSSLRLLRMTLQVLLLGEGGQLWRVPLLLAERNPPPGPERP